MRKAIRRIRVKVSGMLRLVAAVGFAAAAIFAAGPGSFAAFTAGTFAVLGVKNLHRGMRNLVA